MYEPTYPTIVSLVSKEKGGVGDYVLLPSNGKHVRLPYDHFPNDRNVRYIIPKRRLKRDMRIAYRCFMEKEFYFGWIEDKILVARIMKYMADYYGQKYTNCSAFAHFLTTGRFVECSEGKSLLVVEQGMSAYKGQKVRVGDMICIIYAHDRFCRSRRFSHSSKYQEVKKRRRKDGRFVHSLLPKNENLTSDEIAKICRHAVSDDYHFLVCVGKYNGKPVWISQQGRYHPDNHASPLCITIGECDGYTLDVPLLTLIKRRRR